MNLHSSSVRDGAQHDDLEQRLTALADAGTQSITDRLGEIDREWSAGRMAKAVSGFLILGGMALAVLTNSAWWLLVPAAGGALLLQNIFSRPTWLSSLFNGLGFRTGAEIDQERYALKALRGDFRHLPTVQEIVNEDDLSRLEGEGGIVIDSNRPKPDAKNAVRDVIEATKG